MPGQADAAEGALPVCGCAQCTGFSWIPVSPAANMCLLHSAATEMMPFRGFHF